MASVLLVDDEPVFLAVLEEILTLEGVEVTAADSPAAALTTLQDTPVDLIITDTMLGWWDSEVPMVQQLQHAAPGTPLVLFTAHHEAHRLERAACGLAAVWLK